MAKTKKENRGGAGRNQGRKQKYGEPTVVLQTRCPESKVGELKEHIEKKLKKWVKKGGGNGS